MDALVIHYVGAAACQDAGLGARVLLSCVEQILKIENRSAPAARLRGIGKRDCGDRCFGGGRYARQCRARCVAKRRHIHPSLPHPPQGVGRKVVRRHVGGQHADGVEDGPVARATAQVAVNRTLQLLARAGGFLAQLRVERHHKAGRAVAALAGVREKHCLLQRVQLRRGGGARGCNRFDGSDMTVLEGRHGRHTCGDTDAAAALYSFLDGVRRSRRSAARPIQHHGACATAALQADALGPC